MSENSWKRVEYETWDEAFRGLVAAVRQQSVRVASYTQVLFLQACADSFGKGIPGSAEQMRSQYGDLAYKCGLYHQLGKALVPPEYQIWQDDFTDEEKAVYQKYTTDGRTLVATLQNRGQRAKEKRKGELDAELPTDNIPWRMIRESCEQHMERFDGSGYPAGLSGGNISPIAQIVGIARELDQLASQTWGETPFDDAYQVLLAKENVLWSSELLQVLKNAEPKCRAVYNKYIHYTMTLPKTIPLVEKREDRPMGLLYRPMVSDSEGTVVAYEAEPWFGATVDQTDETEGIAEVHEMLLRTGLVADMAFYFLYEATDTLLRMQNCKIETRGILLKMLPGFYSLGTQLQRFTQLFEDQDIPRSKLMITLPEDIYLSASKTRKEIIGRYLRAGVALVLDGYHPDKIDYGELVEMGFRYLRLAPETYIQRETAEQIQVLLDHGFTVLGCNADTYDQLTWQVASGIAATCGTLTGVPVTEEALIRDRLAIQNGKL